MHLPIMRPGEINQLKWAGLWDPWEDLWKGVRGGRGRDALGFLSSFVEHFRQLTI